MSLKKEINQTQEQQIKPEDKLNLNGKLSEEEVAKFGDRVPLGYKKLELIGRGGKSLVWRAESYFTGSTIALKQFPKVGDTMDNSIALELYF